MGWYCKQVETAVNSIKSNVIHTLYQASSASMLTFRPGYLFR